MRKPPNGHVIVKDENYLIQAGDRFVYTHWNVEEHWYSTDSDMIGRTIKQFNQKYIYSKKPFRIMIATKGILPPRFKCDKPFPFGY